MVGIRQPGSLNTLLIGRVQSPEADIFQNGIGKQKGVLQHQAEAAAQVCLADIADILAVNGDPAAVDLIKTGQQVDDGRLARAGRTDQGDGLSRLCLRVISLMIGLSG